MTFAFTIVGASAVTQFVGKADARAAIDRIFDSTTTSSPVP